MSLAAPLLVAFSYFFGSFPTAYLAPALVTAGCGALALLTFAKRLLANREPLREPKSEILLNRLLFDRDVRDREEWIKRVPSERR